MTYWQKKFSEDIVIQTIEKMGMEEACKAMKITQEQAEWHIIQLQWKYDGETFSRDCLKISDKYGNVVPLIYNNGQKKIRDAIDRQRLAGKPVRVALLKARQFGGSTEFEAEIFRESVLRTSRSSMIIAHDLDSARHLREMSERYYDYYTFAKPRLKRETDKWWKFMHYVNKKKVESHLRIDTAEELSTGHSLTLHNLHLSEIQNWRNASMLVKGLFPTVPSSADTMIFMEGTGSGVGDYWYDFCQMAQEPSTGWEFVFVGWYEIEDYTQSFESIEKRGEFISSLDDEEKIYISKGISPEQLYWRRTKIQEDYKGDEDAFRQQYPFDADEAFLTSGSPVFRAIRVKEALAKSKPPIQTGNLIWKKRDDNTKYVDFEEQKRGLWEIWQEKVTGIDNLYCGGFDVAEGIAIQPEFGIKGGDFSSGKIFRRDERRMVAKINVRLDPDMFAEEIYKAGLYWQRLGILVENNPGGSGNVVIRDLKSRTGIVLLKTVTLDKVHDVKKQEYGWDTNKESKRELIDELTENIREQKFVDFDRDFWYQCSTYVRDAKGRTNAQPRKYDDLVIAGALVFQADKRMPMIFKPVFEVPKTLSADMDVPYNWSKRSPVPSQAQVMEANYAEI